ncbi:MAG: type III pantothenate kinase [Limnochordales bacterium]|nr:MAG: type III pantothenate kinase [Bacillota bacterium]
MLLAIDIGNTNITFGLFRGEKLQRTWSLSTDIHRTAAEYEIQIDSLFQRAGHSPVEVDAVVMGNVVPPLQAPYEEVVQNLFGLQPYRVSASHGDTGLKILVDNPAEVGADRIANAVACSDRYGGPAIVVDLGTATTFDVISADGAYMGGAIAPGVQIASEALFERAAKLPRVELVPPPSPIGRNTVHAMQSGTVYGYVGLVRGLIHQLKEELRKETDAEPRVIATGGLAPAIARYSGVVDILDPHLTLEGLRLLYVRNHPGYGAPRGLPVHGGLNA